jgi:hypothetical protein
MVSTKMGVEHILNDFQLRSLTKNCSCKNSKCQKKYCECYNAGKTCGTKCKCINCENRGIKEPYVQAPPVSGISNIFSGSSNMTFLENKTNTYKIMNMEDGDNAHISTPEDEV